MAAGWGGDDFSYITLAEPAYEKNFRRKELIPPSKMIIITTIITLLLFMYLK